MKYRLRAQKSKRDKEVGRSRSGETVREGWNAMLNSEFIEESKYQQIATGDP
jgi:hypothetical protein